MPDSMTESQGRIVDLKVAGHLMTLDPGLYCVFHAPQPDPGPGFDRGTFHQGGAEDLPGVRISRAPGAAGAGVAIVTFDADGWLGAARNAALVRVPANAAQVLVTFYQDPILASEIPRLKVVRLADMPGPTPVPVPQGVESTPGLVPTPSAPAPAQPGGGITANIQRRGDVVSAMEEGHGRSGSKAWIEGFAVVPTRLIAAEDIEYQAVLGRGWLSPWSAGGQYCGSRGMALPILGLRVRLKPEAARRFSCRVSASFTDGTRAGPTGDGAVVEAESLAPLEAFRIDIAPLDVAETPDAEEEALLAIVSAPDPAPAVPKPARRGPAARRPKPPGGSPADRSGAPRPGPQGAGVAGGTVKARRQRAARRKTSRGGS
ncbi:hypothetical protein [Gluconacetobacter diazotrophicus]|uniref:Conserved protein n=1 Tax=Gluconacetobacter diazotrophicus (strain ATCC 49037 / DSM 5601 / CCUG 37298 / CIP 103539 / LMG 7603 / PAl5) TaxID=272568 RepID=A9H4H4_GLUDA|nr:hypothetical protein [Gluconacetobacter diazotrophicus]CAP57437.1 conserved protein [Gluconacetobacter diazotrophicus PA1 5]